jgi:hypothetical protein
MIIQTVKIMEENLYDEIVIQLVKDGKPAGQIRMEKGSIEALKSAHGQTTGDIMDLMLQTLEEEARNKKQSES